MLPLSHIAGGRQRLKELRRALPWSLLFIASCGRDSPSSARVLLARAGELGSKERHVEAARLLRAGLEAAPPAERAEMRLGMARHYHRAGLPLNALEDAEEAIRSGVSAPEACYIQGESLRRVHRLAEAEKVLGKVLELDPENHPARLSLACMRFRSSDPAEALPLFEAYFKAAGPGEARYREALLEHGRALRAAGRHGEAADRFMLLLERDPLDSSAYPELSSALYRLRRRREGRLVEEIHRRIAQGSLEDPAEKQLFENGAAAQAFARRASNRARDRRFLGAFRSFRQSLEVNPGDPAVRMELADLCLRFRRLRDARECIEEGLRLGGKPASGLWLMKARVQLEERDFGGALLAIGKAEEALAAEGGRAGKEAGGASPITVHLLHARAAFESGDLAASSRAARRAEEVSRGGWEPHFWRGRIELGRGDAAGAIRLFSEASRRGGQGSPDLLYWDARALEHGGRREEARAELDRLLQSNRSYLEAYEPLLRLEADPSRRADLEKTLADLRALRTRTEALERTADRMPLEEAGEQYLELVKLHFEAKDPAAFQFLFLVADLLPRKPEVLRLLLSGTNREEDLFVRIHLLRRLADLEPENGEVLAELAERYLKLGVRTEEAARLAGRLHAQAPSARSHLLLGETALRRGDPGAAEILRRGVEAFPGDAALKEALSRALEGGR